MMLLDPFQQSLCVFHPHRHAVCEESHRVVKRKREQDEEEEEAPINEANLLLIFFLKEHRS